MDKKRKGEGRVVTSHNLRDLVLEVISSKWPCNVTEIAKELGLLSGDERKDRVKIKKGIKNAIESYEKNENIIPSWRYIKELCGLKIYEDFKEHLSKETTIYTLELLEGSDLI